jgi:phage recombination protein Bet
MSTLQKYEETEDFSKQLVTWTNTYMKGATPDELSLFANVCKRTGLSPEMKQIYPVPRWDSKLGKNVFSFQTSIDGFRLIAERTGRYAPGKQADYAYNDKNEVISATAYVKKCTQDGTWHEVAVTAFYEEYVQLTKDGKPTQFWDRMPHVMLAKCAESLALRKAFPAELSGLYTQEEMAQSHSSEPEVKAVEYINANQVEEIESLLEGRSELEKKLFDWAQIKSVAELPASKYNASMKAIEIHLAKESE